ncbi:sulfite exporter TauE/SafE family protein [Propionivibrio limicola]|uniref:sulfite exporter TauE/SafE family protein n=1 Tax=Propionivibrio limicola TaxID=167645 RepID=UPI00129193BC|nr:sulfite exporter TauE/SafE family protein [Propionivibrio limicola]
MNTLIIALAAFLASGLTLFSGFGLGTLLMPVVALFFPVDIAIGITALVHLANNVFKLGLLGRQANIGVVVRFGLPAVAAAFAGALLLGQLAAQPPFIEYVVAGKALQVVPLKASVGLLILLFVGLELSPAFAAKSFDRKYLPLGGLISGFFGGLSGHQGAFRSMFLIKAGLTKEQFVATGVVLAVMVDVARMSIYGWEAGAAAREVDWWLVGIATISAFLGAFIGARLIRKVTIHSIQLAVSVLLVIVAFGLISGLL